MQQITGIQLSLSGRTSRELLCQMTGWILQPCSTHSQVPRFQCLIVVSGRTPEWCEGDGLIPLGGSWTPSIGENPLFRSVGGGCSSWRILQENVPQKYYLSPAVCSRILRLAAKAGCPPPAEIEYLLLKQGGRYPSCVPSSSGGCGQWQSRAIKKVSARVSAETANPSQLCLPGEVSPSHSGMREKSRTFLSGILRPWNVNGSWACPRAGRHTAARMNPSATMPAALRSATRSPCPARSISWRVSQK